MLLSFVGVKSLIFAYGASIGVELALHATVRSDFYLIHKVSGRSVDSPDNTIPISRVIFILKIT